MNDYTVRWAQVMMFNSYRPYGYKGQRMICVQYKGGVLFQDLDRAINGYLEDCRMDATEIMRRYDEGGYQMSHYTPTVQALFNTISPYNDGIDIYLQECGEEDLGGPYDYMENYFNEIELALKEKT